MSHTGQTIRRFTARGFIELCPFGHLVATHEPELWAGSDAEAHASDPPRTVTCDGAIRASQTDLGL